MPASFIDITDADDRGQRIDNFLVKHLKGVPKQKVYSILRKGEVRVNGGRVKPSYRLEVDDRLRIPPLRSRAEAPTRLSTDTKLVLQECIIYEDDDVIALNKPAGFAVHGGSSISAGIVEMLRELRSDPKIELAHRLDRDTSGVLLLCKRRSVLKYVQSAFRERTVKKKYLLIVNGQWAKNTKSVSLRLHRYTTSWGERRVRVSDEGQTARTDFEIIESASRASLLEASLHTGRTHQIRVHAQSQGHSILGDTKYARETDPQISRLCLHAKRLVVPLDDRRLDLRAPMEASMEAIWQQLLTD